MLLWYMSTTCRECSWPSVLNRSRVRLLLPPKERTRLEHEGRDTGEQGAGDTDLNNAGCASGCWGRWRWGGGRALGLAVGVLGAHWLSRRGGRGWGPGRVAAWNWVGCRAGDRGGGGGPRGHGGHGGLAGPRGHGGLWCSADAAGRAGPGVVCWC